MYYEDDDDLITLLLGMITTVVVIVFFIAIFSGHGLKILLVIGITILMLIPVIIIVGYVVYVVTEKLYRTPKTKLIFIIQFIVPFFWWWIVLYKWYNNSVIPSIKKVIKNINYRIRYNKFLIKKFIRWFGKLK